MTKGARATRKDVAREANVSETIVSYVVNNNRCVDAEKRRRVEEAVKKLNYVPNPIARTLKGKGSYHVLFIADHIENEHFGKLVKEMDEYAYDKGYMISLCTNRNDDEFIANIIGRQVDGVIINSLNLSEEYIEKIIKSGIPVILFANKFYSKKFENVCSLYTGLYSGVKQALSSIIEKGRKEILYIDRISSRNSFSDADDLRMKGYIDGLSEHGLKFKPENFISGCSSEAEVVAKVTSRLKMGNVDAILGRNDNIAMLAMSATKQAGYNVPRNVMVVGYDNSVMSRYSSPALSTVEMDRASIAREAIDMLIAMVGGGKPYKKAFQTKFIERESTMA